MTNQQINPFQIISPEDLSTEDAVSLFVDVLSDFQKIVDPGHVFLVGPRGSGKSMMFRYLMPDCQCLAKNCSISSLDFLGIYVPLKNTNFSLSELHRLNMHASNVLNEHLLTTHIAIKVFSILSNDSKYHVPQDYLVEFKKYYSEVFLNILNILSFTSPNFDPNTADRASNIFEKIYTYCEMLYSQALNYTKKLAFTTELYPYDGDLVDYLSFLFPLLEGLKKISSLPGGPVYLLLDDAHWLSKVQARILNTWISTRTSAKVSLKVSTQENYETFYTITGETIDTPHDYSEIDISTIYTGNRVTKYRERVRDIVARRLKWSGIDNTTPEQFFPEGCVPI